MRTPALHLLLILLLTSCTRTDDRTHIEFWALGREGEVVVELTREFERRNPDIRVDVQQMPWTAAHEKLLTAFVGDSTPDLALIGNSWIPEFEAIGAVADLTALAAQSSAVDQRDYFAGIWATNLVDEKLYGIPWYVDTRVIFYRTDILRAAGFPEAPKTWSEWVRATAAIRKLGNEYAILLPTNEWTQPIALGLQVDAPLLRQGGRFGAFSEPRFRRAFEFYLDFFRRGDAPVLSNSQVANVYQQFAEGEFAMYITGPWQIGEFRRRLPASMQDKWMTAPLPAPDEKEWPGASLAGGGSLAIFEQSEKKEAAWKLIEFLSGPEQQVRFFELCGDLPARRSAWSDPDLANDRHLAAFRTQLENVKPTPAVPQWEQIATTVFDYAEAAIRGRYTAEGALAVLDAKTDAILEKRRWMLARRDE
ncbi:MAG TPA: sugar ABC transporter substrate-binding protein [Thermoanaerobaculia bacterium]|nr:sugar ABC transporter substrate-binding protein [Thermoanaerobaculia bacterium]